jgi:hypothetical protein
LAKNIGVFSRFYREGTQKIITIEFPPKTSLFQQLFQAHLSHHFLIDPTLHSNTTHSTPTDDLMTNNGSSLYDHNLRAFSCILSILRYLLINYLQITAQNPTQIEFINWLSLYVATNITPYSYIFPGKDQLYTLLNAPSISLDNVSITASNLLQSSITTFYKSQIFSTLVHKLQYRTQPTELNHGVNSDLLSFLVTSYQKANKYWSLQLQTFLASGGRFITHSYYQASNRAGGRRAVYSSIGSSGGSIMANLPLQPSKQREPIEHKFWAMIDQYYVFDLPANNKYILPVDALCGHPVIEISQLFSKLKYIVIAKQAQKKQLLGKISGGNDNGVKVVTIVEILDALEFIIELYYHKVELFNAEFEKIWANSATEISQIHNLENSHQTEKLNLIKTITARLNNNHEIVQNLEFINEWRYFIDEVLPVLDLYPNFTHQTVQIGPDVDRLQCPCRQATDFQQIAELNDSDNFDPPTRDRNCLACTYKEAIACAQFINHQLTHDGINPGVMTNGEDKIFEPKDEECEEEEEECEEEECEEEENGLESDDLSQTTEEDDLFNHNDQSIQNDNELNNSAPFLISQKLSKIQNYDKKSLRNCIDNSFNWRDSKLLTNVNAAYLQYCVDLLHPIEMSTEFVNIVTATLPPLYPYRPICNEFGSNSGRNTPLQCQDDDVYQITYNGDTSKKYQNEEEREESSRWENDNTIDPIQFSKFPNTDNVQFHYPHHVSFHLQTTINLSTPSTDLLNTDNTNKNPNNNNNNSNYNHVPYWSRYTPSFTNGLLWYIFTNCTVTLDDLVGLLSSSRLTFYNTPVSVNRYQQTLFVIVILQNFRNNIFYSSNNNDNSNITPQNIHHDSQNILNILWNLLTSPGIQYTMDYSNDDIIYSVLFNKDEFGWILSDYIKFCNVYSYAPQWCDMIEQQYQLYNQPNF